MTKSKVGAEPKKQRIRHAVTKSEGIHEGIHRDEYGYYDSSYHCYCFAYGYFFHRGISLAVKLTPYYIKNNWDREGWCGGLKGACMDRIDRKRKIAVIKEGTEYAWNIERGLPQDYTIYKTDEDFARYYNLQDRLSFPLDKTTDECMENHLIHLPSGKTISAVGTIDI